ncbi:MAG: hypothetical protein IPM50_10300 [Acidobacteriota bacterium]|nr:MAG: hypothetical protein IPM50_10300 [Acidobacteriota bacterium]
MRTTLTLDDEVVLGIKRLQKKNPDATFKHIINDVIRKGLEAEGEMVKVPFKVRADKKARPKSGINYDSISRLISIAEGDSHR